MAISFAKSEAKRTKPAKPHSAKPETTKGARRGPKPSGKAKQLLTLRLDPDVIAGYRATGDGWQVLMNTVLRRYLHL